MSRKFVNMYLVHVTTKKLILFLYSLYKTLWRNNTSFLLLRANLQEATPNHPLQQICNKVVRIKMKHEQLNRF